MKCEFCEKEIEKGVKFCPNCGADLDPNDKVTTDNTTNTKETKETKQSKEKKKIKPGKIIFIVFLCSALFVGLMGAALVGLFAVAFKDVAFDEIVDEVNSYKDFDEDYFEENFENKFDEGFQPGKISRKNNGYSSDYLGLSFMLPASWDIYDESDLQSVYNYDGYGKELVNNKLFVYDLYADNTISSESICIAFYNKDYYSKYKNISEFNNYLIDDTKTNVTSYDVDFADNSNITIGGEKYSQLACRISNDSLVIYQYDFTRDLGDYYVDICIVAYDLDAVGSIIDILNSKG
ncbi:MAG: zinc ribbon domain-containing protein [Oscillospiraceae bacterium]|nr:zinc ribbon domain-containing protein [Candidatus Limimonas coprohippi]